VSADALGGVPVLTFSATSDGISSAAWLPQKKGGDVSKETQPSGSDGTVTQQEKMVIVASSVGTVFEWYDFFLYGALAVFIGRHFFSGVNETTSFILALLAFAAGFAVRPFGALVFGRLGDMWGRKNTFLATLVIMGLATFSVGLLPTHAQIGSVAAYILITMRLLQGLAIGGVYGGAATYVGEHAPEGKRGLYTSWIQTTATIGLVLSLLVVLLTRTVLGEEAFGDWGWRIPFLISILLLGVTTWIQLKLNESPVYARMKASGKSSKNPWRDSFGNKKNLKLVLIALFGAVVGQGVIWYAGQFYLLFFVERVLKVDGPTTNILMSIALLLAAPLFIFFGWLSDKVGRKPVLLAGFLLAVVTYFPLFQTLTKFANPDLANAAAASPITVVADPRECSLQFDPIGNAEFNTSCDIAKSFLARAGVPYETIDATAGSVAEMKIGGQSIPSFSGENMDAASLKTKRAEWESSAQQALLAAAYPLKADPAKINKPMVVLIMFLIIGLATVVYGPIAAFLVEFFPTRIRYTSMSLPYHIGNGWFGGFLPTTAFAIVAATGNIYSGLWYPVIFAAATFVIGLLFLPETKNIDIHRDID
jgi:MFS family permease